MPLSDKQLAIRKLGITASEAPAVAGLNPYVKPIDVFAAKLDLVDPFEGNKASRWGDLLEKPIALHYAAQHAAEKIVVRHPRTIAGSIDGTLVRDVSPRFKLIATPDRLVYHKRIPWPFRNLQIKTAGLRQEDKWGEPGTDQIPEHYLIQVAAEMAVVDVAETDLVVLIGGQDDREYRVPRDLELEGQLLEICERFWVDHIMTGVPPPVDGSEQYSSYLKQRFPRDERPLLPETDEARRWYSELLTARDREDAAKARRAEAENALKAIIADAGGIEGLCTWRQNKPSRVTDWEAAWDEWFKNADLTTLSHAASIISKHTATKPGARPFKPIIPKEK
jgi:putative phage-type endonuclease